MIMNEMVSQLRGEAVHFLQVPKGESSTQLVCLSYKGKDQCCVHIIDDA